MKACVAVVLSLVSGACLAQTAYPETEAAAAWRGLAASYVRKALRDQVHAPLAGRGYDVDAFFEDFGHVYRSVIR